MKIDATVFGKYRVIVQSLFNKKGDILMAIKHYELPY